MTFLLPVLIMGVGYALCEQVGVLSGAAGSSRGAHHRAWPFMDDQQKALLRARFRSDGGHGSWKRGSDMMKQAAQRAIEMLESMGASYGDARAETVTMEKMVFRNGRLEQGIVRDSAGLGVRAVVGGAWGFRGKFGFRSGQCRCRRAGGLSR
ncbi:MAG: hypothetical protein MZU95_05770 [Desulfomicrobium escambiense]|nr:hypothetical protein [Desulfomicrobium escambiense]